LGPAAQDISGAASSYMTDAELVIDGMIGGTREIPVEPRLKASG
jgi:hypothetical protein